MCLFSLTFADYALKIFGDDCGDMLQTKRFSAIALIWLIGFVNVYSAKLPNKISTCLCKQTTNHVQFLSPTFTLFKHFHPNVTLFKDSSLFWSSFGKKLNVIRDGTALNNKQYPLDNILVTSVRILFQIQGFCTIAKIIAIVFIVIIGLVEIIEGNTKTLAGGFEEAKKKTFLNSHSHSFKVSFPTMDETSLIFSLMSCRTPKGMFRWSS